MTKLAAGLLLAVSLSGCQAAVFAAVDVGLSILVKSVELDNALIENVRDATGLCVGRDLRSKPCPPPAVKP